MQTITAWSGALCALLTILCGSASYAACSYEQAVLAQDLDVGVRLTWSTNLETDHAYFLVEASVDGRTFREVGRVAGAGDSEEVRAYEYLHTNAPERDLYYRLREVSTTGTQANGPVAYFSRADIPDFYVTYLSDALTSEELTVHLEATTETPVAYELRHWSGELVDTYKTTLEEGFNEISLPVEHLEAAIYKVRIETEETTKTLTLRKVEEGVQHRLTAQKE